MAERLVIDLLVETGGSLRTIQDFRDFVKDAKKQLEGLEVGTETFNRLSASIGSANTRLKELEKIQAGLTREEIAGAYARIGGGISSSFAAAQAAVASFGIKNEAVLEAAAKAQNLLTIAVSTRQIQEGLLSARLLANIVAQNAYNASVAAGNVITKTFYATIAANPFGAIIALIGVLVTATIALSNALKETTTQQQEFDKALKDTQPAVETEIAQIQILNGIIQDNTKSQKERNAALDQLKESVPQIADLTLKQANAEERINEAVKAQIPLLQQKARVQAAAAIFEKAVQEQLENQIEGLDKYNFTLRTIFAGLAGPAARFSSVLAQAGEDGAASFKKSEQALKILTEETGAYNLLLSESTTIQEGNTKSKLKNARATKEQELSYKTLQKELKSLQDILKAEIEVYEQLGKVADAEKEIPKLVQKTNELLAARLKIIDKANKGIIKSFTDLGFVVDKETGKFKDASQEVDQFGLTIELLRKELAILVEKQDFKTLAQQVAIYRQEAVKAFSAGLIDRTQFNSLLELTDNYENLSKVISRFPELSSVLGADFLPKYLSNFGKLARIGGEIKFDFDETTGKIKEASLANIDLNAERLKAVKLEKEGVEKLTAVYLAQAETNIDRFLQEADLSFQQKKIIEDQIKSLRAAGKEEKEIAADVAASVAKARLDALTSNVKAIVQEEDAIRGFFFNIQQNNQKNAEISKETARSILTSNLQETRNFVGGQITITKGLAKQFQDDIKDGFLNTNELAKKYGNQFIQLQELLNKKGVGDFELSEEEKLKILQFYLEQQGKEEEKADQRRLRNLNRIVSSFKTLVQAINEFQQIFAQQTELELERLRINNERQLAMIVGDTAEANAKREELNKEYIAQEQQLTKQARITSLRFSLIQATANTAEAITKAFTAGPIIGQIAAGIAAVASAAQIGIITSQINLAQSLKKGGMIRGQSGMVVNGPSHENGGVMFNNGGFNLEGGEMVVNRTSSKQYSDLLSQINMAGGGRPLVISNFDDSRIVDAIAKQKQDSIRAYVVEQDISNKQAKSRRLSQLAQF